MCRYGQHTYKESFACFDCRKTFKQTNRYELPETLRPSSGQARQCKYPQCGNLMADLGFDFKAPKQSDRRQWQKVRILFEHGFDFYSCGCGGPGFRPAKLNDVHDFIQDKKKYSKGELLLDNITKKIRK